jgi:hypothetical protein
LTIRQSAKTAVSGWRVGEYTSQQLPFLAGALVNAQDNNGRFWLARW